MLYAELNQFNAVNSGNTNKNKKTPQVPENYEFININSTNLCTVAHAQRETSLFLNNDAKQCHTRSSFTKILLLWNMPYNSSSALRGSA